MTSDDIAAFTKEVDSLLVSAPSAAEMYRKLGRLRANSSTPWQLLRSPAWVGDSLVAVLLAPPRPLESESDAAARPSAEDELRGHL